MTKDKYFSTLKSWTTIYKYRLAQFETISVTISIIPTWIQHSILVRTIP